MIKSTRLAFLVGLASMQLLRPFPLHAVTFGGDVVEPPSGRTLMERLSDRPKKTFMPIEWSNKDWSISPWGYVRLEYESVQNDDRVTNPPIGRNDGFILDNARLGLDLTYRDQLSFLMSLEGASDIQNSFNSPSGQIDVRLRDAYVRWDPIRYIGIQGGQFKAPFDAEDLRPTPDLLFASTAVGWQGVLAGRGYQEAGISLDRQLGVMLSPNAPIRYGDFGGMYYFMIGNGNGTNQLLNDNSRLTIIGRVEAMYSKLVTLGAAGFTNDRTIADPPNQAREDDTGVAADLMINPDPFEVFFQFGQVETDFPTTGVSSRIRRTWHAQAGYRIDTPWSFSVTPAYRYAFYDPWANAGSNSGASENALALYYHTFGMRLAHTGLPLTLFINYTLAEEQNPRQLTNDQFQILAQVVF